MNHRSFEFGQNKFLVFIWFEVYLDLWGLLSFSGEDDREETWSGVKLQGQKDMIVRS